MHTPHARIAAAESATGIPHHLPGAHRERPLIPTPESHIPAESATGNAAIPAESATVPSLSPWERSQGEVSGKNGNRPCGTIGNQNSDSGRIGNRHLAAPSVPFRALRVLRGFSPISGRIGNLAHLHRFGSVRGAPLRARRGAEGEVPLPRQNRQPFLIMLRCTCATIPSPSPLTRTA